MLFQLQFHANNLPALLIGAFLLVVSIVLTLQQWRAHYRLVLNSKVNEAGFQVAERQIRHRMAVAIILLVLAIMIPLGDQMDIFFRGHPGIFFAYWMSVLLLILAMVLVAVGDIVSTLAYARLSQVELRRERQELEEEIRRYRESQAASNGKTKQD